MRQNGYFSIFLLEQILICLPHEYQLVVRFTRGIHVHVGAHEAYVVILFINSLHMLLISSDHDPRVDVGWYILEETHYGQIVHQTDSARIVSKLFLCFFVDGEIYLWVMFV